MRYMRANFNWYAGLDMCPCLFYQKWHKFDYDNIPARKCANAFKIGNQGNSRMYIPNIQLVSTINDMFVDIWCTIFHYIINILII